jgi:hypothetical protein
LASSYFPSVILASLSGFPPRKITTLGVNSQMLTSNFDVPIEVPKEDIIHYELV